MKPVDVPDAFHPYLVFFSFAWASLPPVGGWMLGSWPVYLPCASAPRALYPDATTILKEGGFKNKSPLENLEELRTGRVPKCVRGRKGPLRNEKPGEKSHREKLPTSPRSSLPPQTDRRCATLCHVEGARKEHERQQCNSTSRSHKWSIQ